MSTATDVRLKARYKSEIQSALKSEFGNCQIAFSGYF